MQSRGLSRIDNNITEKKFDTLVLGDDEYIKEEIEKAGKRVLLLKLQIEHVCGKTVKES